jgi:hypothetical protein
MSGLVILALLLACGLTSGTFVISHFFRDIDFTTRTGFYYYLVDLNDDPDWEEHADDIESIDAVGFELWITSHETESATFSIYLDEATGPAYETEDDLVVAEVPKVLDGLTINPGANTVSYGESLGYLINVDSLSARILEGTFGYYGVSSYGTSDGYTIDSVRVVVTVTVSL